MGYSKTLLSTLCRSTNFIRQKWGNPAFIATYPLKSIGKDLFCLDFFSIMLCFIHIKCFCYITTRATTLLGNFNFPETEWREVLGFGCHCGLGALDAPRGYSLKLDKEPDCTNLSSHRVWQYKCMEYFPGSIVMTLSVNSFKNWINCSAIGGENLSCMTTVHLSWLSTCTHQIFSPS